MMKITKKVVIFLALIFALTASSCSFCDVDQSDVLLSDAESSLPTDESTVSLPAEPDIIVAEDALYYNFINESAFGFNVIAFSKEQITEMELVEVSGQNVDHITVELKNDTFDSMKDEKYRGYYITMLGFTGTSECEQFSIEQIKVKLSGKEITIQPQYPIVHSSTINEVNDSYQYVCDGGRPLMFTSSSIAKGTNVYTYGFDAFEDIEILSVRTDDIVDFDEVILEKDGKELGSLDMLAPYAIGKDEAFSFSIQFSYADHVTKPIGFGVMTSLMLDYRISDGSVHTLYVPIIIQGVTYLDEFHALLDSYLGTEL